MQGDRVSASPLQTAICRVGAENPLHHQRSARCGNSLGVDSEQSGRGCEEAEADCAPTEATVSGGGSAHRRGIVGARHRLGNADLAQDGDRRTPRGTARSSLARRPSRRGRPRDPPQLHAAKRKTREKDTKTHQMRRISLDPDTVDLLSESIAAARRTKSSWWA